MTIKELAERQDRQLKLLGDRGNHIRALLSITARYISAADLTDAEVRLFANMIVEASQVADEQPNEPK